MPAPRMASMRRARFFFKDLKSELQGLLFGLLKGDIDRAPLKGISM